MAFGGFEECRAYLKLSIARLTAEEELVGEADAGGVVGRFGLQADGEGLGLADHEFSVHHEELLHRNRGADAALASEVGVRKVEQPQRAIEVMAADGGVERAAR